MSVSVYIAEDEEWIRMGLKKMIRWQALGLELAGEAEDGETAVQQILALRPQILLSDIRMPLVSGLEVARRVQAELPELKTIFISGHRDFEYAQQAIDLRSVKYMLKPVDDEELNQVLMQVTRELLTKNASPAAPSSIINLLGAPVPSQAIMQRVTVGIELGDPDQAPMLAKEVHSELDSLALSQSDALAYLTTLCMDTASHLRRKGFDVAAGPDELKAYMAHPRKSDSDDWVVRWLSALAGEVMRSRSGGVTQIIERVKDYIDNHYTWDISLSQMAERFYINLPYLSSAFKRVVGQNFQDYILKKRMDKAAEILLETQLSVAEVASIVGYDDVRHFSRMFKKHLGMNPSDYRVCPREAP